MTRDIDDTLRAMHTALEGITAMRKRVKDLESRLKTTQARAEHYRSLTLAQSRDIKRLKKGLKV